MLKLLAFGAVYLATLVTSALGFGFTTSGNSIIVTTDGGLVFTG